MLDLNELRYKGLHPRKQVFDSYDWGLVAGKLGISEKQFVNILFSYETPPPDVDKRIHDLADQIEVAEAIE